MTTFVPFQPTATSVFQFTATLDGQPYVVTTWWCLAGQRWFVSVRTPTGAQVVNKARAGSPPGYDINIVWGYFKTSTLVYREATGNYEIGP